MNETLDPTRDRIFHFFTPSRYLCYCILDTMAETKAETKIFWAVWAEQPTQNFSPILVSLSLL